MAWGRAIEEESKEVREIFFLFHGPCSYYLLLSIAHAEVQDYCKNPYSTWIWKPGISDEF